MGVRAMKSFNPHKFCISACFVIGLVLALFICIAVRPSFAEDSDGGRIKPVKEFHYFSANRAVMMSSLYEFAIDQLERQSIQDLIATPVIGSLAGIYFMDLRKRIKSEDTFNSQDKLVLVVTDRLGALNNLVDRLLGIGPGEKMHCNLLLAKGTGLEKTPDNSVQKSPMKTGSSPVFGLRISVNW